jgi:FAD/FMN-containing dehydrogenase/Fe-S oxidoreductase
MSTSLTVLRERDESQRFARLRKDDSRTSIADAAGLAADLKAAVDGEVRFDKGTRALYATDGSNYRQAPIGVVVPRHENDVETTVRLARQYGAPVLSRGGGTSLGGQCCNVAVVMDFSKYMFHVPEIDAARRIGRVQPGCVLDHFRDYAKQSAGLWFGPDPATHNHCTIGGMLGNNSCGSHSLMSKNNGLGLRTSDNTHAMDVLLYDGTRMHVGPTSPAELDAHIRGGGRHGQVYADLKRLVDKYGDAIRQFPKLERRVSGYNLPDLLPENGFNLARALVGSESTLVTILEAQLQLIPAAKAKTVVMLGFKDVYTAAECALTVLDFNPAACEGIDELLFEYVKKKGDESAALVLLPEGPAYLLCEFHGEDKGDADHLANRCIDKVKTLGDLAPVGVKLYDDPQQEEMIWKVREGALGSTAWIPGERDTWPGFEDSAVPVEHVPQYLRELRDLYHKFGYNPSLYGHMGQGCIHCRVQFDLYTAEGIDTYKRFMEAGVELVMKFGGVASGEHGDGQARGQFLEKQFGPELYAAMKEMKRIFDPTNKMNTGKVINLDGEPYTDAMNLRVGADYNPPEVQTHFSFSGDNHSFGRAALRCVGVGLCRREGDGTMCPSYMVTREESASTRGRARMLYEMMNGEVVEDGWKSDAVKESLDLCMSCKGCKGDCPVNVDMTTYKGEFLSHYYEGRLRPRHMYAFGWIAIWSKLASHAPTLANLVTQTPGLSSVAKWMANVHPKRKVPPFAPRSLQQWAKGRKPKHPAGPPVVLFPDTFNNFFHSDVAIAAVDVLEDAGFCVAVPQANVCCGRPLYDYGFLPMAKRWWHEMLRDLQPQIEAGIPMVVLEPSCWASFKDELTNLLPANLDAIRLKELTYTLGDFLREKAPHYALPKLHRNAIVHGHCHQKALDALDDKEYGKLHAEKAIMDAMEIKHAHPDAGCCGMAGAFGYERANGHYDVAIAVGDRVLLPEVRRAPDDTLIIADGFSCQEQIQQDSDRHALHLAQVLQMAIKEGHLGVAGRPERPFVERRAAERRKANVHTAMMVGIVAAVGAVLAGTALAARKARRS